MNETENKDRISKYLAPRIQNMMFAELSPDYLERTNATEILSGIPVPVGIEGSDAKGAIDLKSIVLNMARVMGGDPLFLYADKYSDFIRHAVGENAVAMLVSEGAHSADMGDFEDACMLLRAALRLDPKSREALYLYARACKEAYETEASMAEDGMGDEERIGLFKAESSETFELLTMIHPDFAMGYYFLGYAYLNMGLYLKARLTWQDFLRLSSGSETEIHEMDDQLLASLREEISERVEELEEPVQIELGCNSIMGGDFAGGRDTLMKFTEGRYSQWWPLWYYLGVADASLGNADEAIADLKKVLTLSPSNTDAMDELVHLYEATGDAENASKYRNKIGIVNNNRKEENGAM